MTKRAERKQNSRLRILDAGSARLRSEGLDGAAIAPVMHMAGLTHGAFYAHFANKEAMNVAAFRHAMETGRERWIGNLSDRSWKARAARLAKSYLNKGHRDDRAGGCALAAIGGDSVRASSAFRRVYAKEVRRTLAAICETTPAAVAKHPRYDDAIALLSLCVGGLTLARASVDPAVSDRILKVCREVAARGEREMRLQTESDE